MDVLRMLARTTPRLSTTRSMTMTSCLAVAASLVLAACAKDAEDWKTDLASPDAYVRGLASIGWSLQDPRGAGPALPVLLETIDRAEVGLEREAAAVLRGVGAFHVDELLAQLTGAGILTGDRRGAILNALLAAGPAAAAPIVRCLTGPGREQAGDLGEVLLLIGAPAVPAISGLAASSDDAALQQFAIFLLGRLGPQARASLPVLQSALASPHEGVRQMARQAIGQVDGVSDADGH